MYDHITNAQSSDTGPINILFNFKLLAQYDIRFSDHYDNFLKYFERERQTFLEPSRDVFNT